MCTRVSHTFRPSKLFELAIILNRKNYQTTTKFSFGFLYGHLKLLLMDLRVMWSHGICIEKFFSSTTHSICGSARQLTFRISKWNRGTVAQKASEMFKSFVDWSACNQLILFKSSVAWLIFSGKRMAIIENLISEAKYPSKSRIFTSLIRPGLELESQYLKSGDCESIGTNGFALISFLSPVLALPNLHFLSDSKYPQNFQILLAVRVAKAFGWRGLQKSRIFVNLQEFFWINRFAKTVLQK